MPWRDSSLATCVNCLLSDPLVRQDASTTLCTFYEIMPQSKEAAAQDGQFFIQFITRYLHADGSHRVRATTFTRRCPPFGPAAFLCLGCLQQTQLEGTLQSLPAVYMPPWSSIFKECKRQICQGHYHISPTEQLAITAAFERLKTSRGEWTVRQLVEILMYYALMRLMLSLCP
jgi:hypothetical protein